MSDPRPHTADCTAFGGYLHADGSVGVRNHLLVLNLTGLTEAVARRVTHRLNGAVLASFSYGMGLIGQDQDNATRALRGLAQNPNAGVVLVLSADRTRLEEVSEILRGSGKPFVALALDDAGHDALTLAELAVRAGADLLRTQSRRHRHMVGSERLCIALECGLSDPTSGIAANPLIGKVADRVIAAGGTVILGETLEWLGVEDVLADRAVSAEVGEQLRQAVLRRERLAADAGVDLQGINPNRRNIEEGLTTIEEKATGSAAKSGTAPITGVLRYGEAPQGPGLWVMDAPSYTPESLTGFAAAGAQIVLFSTGSGNSYTSALMPTLKLTANAETARRLSCQIDHDCSALMTGGSMETGADALMDELLRVANGALTFGEILGEGGETVSRYGEAL